jgi:hypothetical protein
MLHSMMNAIFRCGHQRTTFPITPRRGYAGSSPVTVPRNGTYVVCLDCGKQFAYDWKSMRIGELVTEPMAQQQTELSINGIPR